MEDLKKLAFSALAAGEKTKALQIYMDQLGLNPRDFDAAHMAGVLLAEHGKPEQGVGLLEQALAIAKNEYIYNNYGNILQALGRLDLAEQAFKEALNIKIKYPEAHSNLGNIYLQKQDYQLALDSYGRAIKLRPDFADAIANRSIVLHAMGHYAEAVQGLEHALSLHPNSSAYHLAYAEVRMDMYEFNAAELFIERALQLDPNSGLAYSALGRLNAVRKNYTVAVDLFLKSLSLAPSNLAAYRHCALAYSHLGDKKQAAEMMQKALALNPYDPNLLWELCFVEIPAIVESKAHALRVREQFNARIRDISERPDRYKIKLDTIANVGPFYLMYHGINDRDIYEKYGILCKDIIGQKFSLPTILKPKKQKRIKICVVTGTIQKHSVWSSNIEGFYRRIDRQAFEIHTINLTGKFCAEAQFAEGQSDIYEDLSSASFQDVANAILGSAADILFYPEIGLHSTVIRLANLRLCRNQITTWGNPETLGFENIDYFFSVQEFEGNNAQDFYSEKLILLPLNEHYYASKILTEKKDVLDELGLDSKRKIILCLGSSFKFQYNFFVIFKEIWKNNHGLQFVFSDQGDAIGAYVKSEIEKSIIGLEGNNVLIFIPWIHEDTFYSLMRYAYLALEGMNFSGYNMAIQALECGLPIVCKQGEMLRENFAAGLLKTLEADEFVAQNLDVVPGMFQRLLEDVDFYGRYKLAVQPERVKSVLFDRLGPMPAFEGALREISSNDAEIEIYNE